MHRLLLTFLIALLTACGNPVEESPPAALEPPGDARGFYCGMTLAEHPGPKGQIHVAGESKPLWFSSVHDALAYLQLEGSTRRIRSFYVHDMGQATWQKPESGTWIDARQGWFVMGSRRFGGMGGSEVVPFSDPTQAEAFARQYGGTVMDFAKIRKEEMFPMQGDALQPAPPPADRKPDLTRP